MGEFNLCLCIILLFTIPQQDMGKGSQGAKRIEYDTSKLQVILEHGVRRRKPKFELNDDQQELWELFACKYGSELAECVKNVDVAVLKPFPYENSGTSGPIRIEQGWIGDDNYHAIYFKFDGGRVHLICRCKDLSSWWNLSKEESSRRILKAVENENFEHLSGLTLVDIYVYTDKQFWSWKTLKCEFAEALISRQAPE